MSGEQVNGFLIDPYLSPLPSPLCFGVDRPAHDGSDVLVRQRLEYEHAAARQQRRGQLEARGLARSADQGDDPVLDPGEKRVLLRPVEAMDLVAKQDRAPALVLKPLLRFL